MSSASDPHSILNRNPGASVFKVPNPKTKIERYFPGKTPDFIKDEDSDDDIFPGINDKKSLGDTSITSEKMQIRLSQLESFEKQRTIFKAEAIKNNSNKKEERKIEKTTPIIEEEISTKIEVKSAKINSENIEIFDDTQTRSRRAAIKAKLLEKENSNIPSKKKEIIEFENNNVEDSEKDEYSEEDEEEESENEENKPITSILKPVFVSKEDRDNFTPEIIEEVALEEEAKKLKERKKIEAKLLVSEAIKTNNDKEDEDAEKSNSEQEIPDDNDEIDIETELESWKIRELKRLKKERQERIKRDLEKAEIQRRRLLTDEERKKEDMLLGSDATEKKEKTPYRFMQKYYHKGAFFQDLDDPILKKDYNTAVGEDLFDKSNLPKILWKRRGNFGKKGQSKYTHLTDQDTTNFDPEVKVDEELREKMYGKMAGIKASDILERKDLRKMKM